MRQKQFFFKSNTNKTGWMIIYADLMSLLMAFFVILLASSELDKKKFAEMGTSMRQALKTTNLQNLKDLPKEFESIDDRTKLLLIEQVMSQQNSDKNFEQTKIDTERLKSVLKISLEKHQVEISSKDKIITIRLLAGGVFKSGEATILSEFWPTIQTLKNTLQTIQGNIIVSGYTDNIPIKTEQYRSNWELSAARAYSVISTLIGGVNMPPSRFTLRGFGETRPIANNDTEVNCAKNRRVEILIDQSNLEGLTG